MHVFTELVNALKKKQYHITAAESCTAGLFCSHIAEVPGASDILSYGFVVYSEEAKCKLLGVQPETISSFGVVREQTAKEMALCAAQKACAEIGISFTGYAGPGADPGFPVGRVCFGYAVKGVVTAETFEFGDIGRNAVREQSAVHAARTVLKLLEAELCF